MFYGSQYRVHKMRRPKSCEKKVVQVDEGDGAVLWGGRGGDRGDSAIQADHEGGITPVVPDGKHPPDAVQQDCLSSFTSPGERDRSLKVTSGVGRTGASLAA